MDALRSGRRTNQRPAAPDHRPSGRQHIVQTQIALVSVVMHEHPHRRIVGVQFIYVKHMPTYRLYL